MNSQKCKLNCTILQADLAIGIVNQVHYIDNQGSGDFELNQLKSAPSQLLPVFPGFHRLQTCCHSFGTANILSFFFFFSQVLAYFFFIVVSTGQELGH
jgi:hypothetical protein